MLGPKRLATSSFWPDLRKGLIQVYLGEPVSDNYHLMNIALTVWCWWINFLHRIHVSAFYWSQSTGFYEPHALLTPNHSIKDLELFCFIGMVSVAHANQTVSTFHTHYRLLQTH